jgi:hypothetical protein
MAGLDADERARINQAMRERGFLLVWDQVDRAGPMSPVEEGMFILERLYPEMPDAHRRSIRRQMEADHRAGRWHGFERPRAR